MKTTSPFLSSIFIIASLGLISSSCSKVKFSSGGLSAVTAQGEPTPTPPSSPPSETPPTATPTMTPSPTGTPIKTPTPPPGGATPTPTPTATPALTKTKSVTVQKNMTQVDILLVIDDSSSMAADNGRLAARLASFTNSLAQANLDWQMCVTTTDTSYYAGAPLVWSGTSSYILNPGQGSSLNSIIQQTIYDIGSGFSNDEQAIYATSLNVSKSAQFACHRPGSTLAAIILSDEDERSVGGIYTLSSAQYKALNPYNMPDTLIQTVAGKLGSAGSAKKFRVHSIVVTEPTCEAKQDAEGSPSFIGKLYMELANKTKGSIGSICDADFGPNLNVFNGIIRNTVSSVPLDCAPAQLSVLGMPAGTTTSTANGSEGATVSFNPPLPEGTTVTINYKCSL